MNIVYFKCFPLFSSESLSISVQCVATARWNVWSEKPVRKHIKSCVCFTIHMYAYYNDDGKSSKFQVERGVLSQKFANWFFFPWYISFVAHIARSSFCMIDVQWIHWIWQMIWFKCNFTEAIERYNTRFKSWYSHNRSCFQPSKFRKLLFVCMTVEWT